MSWKLSLAHDFGKSQLLFVSIESHHVHTEVDGCEGHHRDGHEVVGRARPTVIQQEHEQVEARTGIGLGGGWCGQHQAGLDEGTGAGEHRMCQVVGYSHPGESPVRRELSHHEGRKVSSEESHWGEQQQLAHCRAQHIHGPATDGAADATAVADEHEGRYSQQHHEQQPQLHHAAHASICIAHRLANSVSQQSCQRQPHHQQEIGEEDQSPGCPLQELLVVLVRVVPHELRVGHEVGHPHEHGVVAAAPEGRHQTHQQHALPVSLQHGDGGVHGVAAFCLFRVGGSGGGFGWGGAVGGGGSGGGAGGDHRQRVRGLEVEAVLLLFLAVLVVFVLPHLTAVYVSLVVLQRVSQQQSRRPEDDAHQEGNPPAPTQQLLRRQHIPQSHSRSHAQ
mmetsp:Transcript_6857/g.10180  ORF Transcript_6857/g.10180 Transcript_6857/m.10180 type:complete len:391 (-) Transcript_6857:3038-4210(-)